MNKRIWLLLLMIASIAIMVTTVNKRTYDNQAAIAETYVLEGKYPQAVEIYKGLLDKSPKDDALWYMLAVVLQDMARYDEALDAIDHAIENNPDHLPYLIQKGNLYESLDLHSDAQKLYESILSQAVPDDQIQNKVYLSSLGYAAKQLGDSTSAITFYKRALELAPEDQSLYHELAWTYMAVQDYAQAISTFNKVIGIAPEESLNYVYLGDCYYQLNNYNMAIKQYKDALELEPASTTANLKLADCYEQLEIFPLVIQYLEKHLEADPYDFYEYNRLIEFYTTLKMYDEAFNATQRLIQVDPDNPYAYELQANTLYLMANIEDVEAALNQMYDHLSEKEKLYNIGLWFMENDEYDFAVKYMHQCLLKFPLFLDAYHTMAELYQHTGRVDDIDWLFNQITDVFNEETALNAKFRYYSTHDDPSFPQKMVDLCNRLVEIKPRNSDYWIRLGNAYTYINDYEQSNHIFEDMMVQFPNMYEPYYYRGMNAFYTEAYKTAYENYRIASEMNTSDEYLYYRFAECSAVLGKDKEALKYLKMAVQLHPGLENRLESNPHLEKFSEEL